NQQIESGITGWLAATGCLISFAPVWIETGEPTGPIRTNQTAAKPPTKIDRKVMSSKTSPKTYAAFCEEFDEDANVILPGTRMVANTTAQRSKSDLRLSGTSTDGASDSGYSSRTAATVGSGGSLASGKRSPPSVQLDTALA